MPNAGEAGKTRRKALLKENFLFDLVVACFLPRLIVVFYVAQHQKEKKLKASCSHYIISEIFFLPFISFSPLPFRAAKVSFRPRMCSTHTSHDKNISHKELKFLP
jgi:hypothetical protein